ncbi:conserved hypothetical protein [Pediculus humanus corporis]|uniref:Uncharacterized protein n=1 Tax=Pediculus humanus subsp. corporis TaxID=121224 RepID=E0VLC1_PEDHC|nr:uncharacterized protein Phum_PHUM285730 [Pediculus humanus corporis]EEB14177.1 conserved hypothetical protein [Pediculus humanus corporis]
MDSVEEAVSIFFVFAVFISSAFAQFGSALYGATFPSGFVSPFSDFGSASPSSSSSSQGFGNSPSPTNTGPVIFPPAPESRDTSGVIVGASGYGFVPPGSKGSRGAVIICESVTYKTYIYVRTYEATNLSMG